MQSHEIDYQIIGHDVQLLNLTSLAFGGFTGHRKPVSLRHLII